MLANEELATIQQVLRFYDDLEEIPENVGDAFKRIVDNEPEIIRALDEYSKQFEKLVDDNTDSCEDFICLESLKTLRDTITTFLLNAGILFTVSVNGYTIVTFPDPT